MKRRLSGSVTVLVSMSFVLIASLIALLVESTRIQGARVMVNLAATASLNSLFADFETELLEQYGILLFDGAGGSNSVDESALEEKCRALIEENLSVQGGLLYEDGHDFFGVNIDDVKISRVIRADEAGGLLWRRMVLDYATADEAAELLSKLTGIDKIEGENKRVSEAVEVLNRCTDKIGEVNETYLSLASLIDGVRTNTYGIDYSDLKFEGMFVKKYVFSEDFHMDMISISVSSYGVYDKLSNQVADFNTLINELISMGNACLNDMGDLKDLCAYSDLLYEILNRQKEINEEAEKLVMKLFEESEELNSNVEASEKLVDLPGWEVSLYGYDSIRTEYEDVSFEAKKTSRMVENVSGFDEILKSNVKVLSEALSAWERFGSSDKESIDKERLSEVIKSYEKCAVILKDYRTDGLTIDYTMIPSCAKTMDNAFIETLKKYAKQGLLGLLVPESVAVSQKDISKIDSLASWDMEYGSRKDYEISLIDDVVNEFIFFLYISDHFSDFTDSSSSNLLSYEIEYLVSGEMTDKENLFDALLKISGVRLAANTAFAFTNPELKREALVASTAALGITGAYPAVKVLQYVILEAWAIGETIADIRSLLRGEKIPLMKTSGDWKLSLEQLVACKFDEVSKDGNSRNGLSYREYLLGILLLSDNEKVTARTMDLVELHMIGAGAGDFRLKNYVYGLEIYVNYHIGTSKKTYTEHAVYVY